MSSPHLKLIILVAICLQNTGSSVLRKFVLHIAGGTSYLEILLLSEFFKLFASLYFMYNDSNNLGISINLRSISTLLRSGTSFKMMILAGIYGFMNILSFAALYYIGPGEFICFAQLKILSTALCSYLFLGTLLSGAKIRALLLLVIGLMLVISPALLADETAEPKVLELYQTSASEKMFGYGAVLLEVFLGGLASVNFEKVLKSTVESVSIWERNFQLSVFSIGIFLALIFYRNGWQFVFVGFNTFAILTALIIAIGGILVALTLKYADSIMKTIAVSGAIVLTTLCGFLFFNAPLSLTIILGICTAIIAIINYTLDYELPSNLNTLPLDVTKS